MSVPIFKRSFMKENDANQEIFKIPKESSLVLLNEMQEKESMLKFFTQHEL